MSRRPPIRDACDAARAHAGAQKPALARRWLALADRMETLRARLAERSDDREALLAEFEARIARYRTCDRGADLIAGLGPPRNPGRQDGETP